ncbi:hypothetical protein EBU99_12585 [bacterium]|nr:hypothetical protein [bacterium]
MQPEKGLQCLMMSVVAMLSACGLTLKNESATESSVNPAPTISSFKLINEEVTNTIAEAMEKKCASVFSGDEMRLAECNRAAEQMAKELDFNYIKRSDGQSSFVFLNSRLHALLQEKETITFLSQLQSACEDALYLNTPFNLWNFTLEKSNGKNEIATERLAVLFQDGAIAAAQIKFLLVEQNPQALMLAQVVNTLESALAEKKMSAYPAEVQLSRNAIYHYYVPRYLAMKLRQAGHNSAVSARLPFIFNSSYELHQIQKAENPQMLLNHRPVVAGSEATPELRRLIDKWNSYDKLFSDLLDHLEAPLLPFNPQGQSENLEDLYLGYAGALAGVSGRAATTKEFSNFVLEFSQSPSAFIKNN